VPAVPVRTGGYLWTLKSNLFSGGGGAEELALEIAQKHDEEGHTFMTSTSGGNEKGEEGASRRGGRFNLRPCQWRYWDTQDYPGMRKGVGEGKCNFYHEGKEKG